MNKFDEDFDKNFKKFGKMASVIFFINMLIIVVVFGFVGWVIYKLMEHFGVL